MLLIFAAFPLFFLHPKAYLFQNGYDGLKNYFTYQSYIQQNNNENIFIHNNMNYPYQEYIFYTDNTPAFSLPLNVFSHYIYDIEEIAIPLYHYFFLLGILFSTFLLYKILKRGINQPFILFVTALILPWIDIQILRLGVGHFNLSFSWIWLGIIFIALKWEESGYKAYYGLIIAVYMYLISFIHLYYLPIAMIFMGILVAIKMLFILSEKKAWIGAISMGAGTGIGAIAVLKTIQGIDAYYHFRSKIPMGYDARHYKLKISAIVTPFDFNTIPFLWKGKDTFEYENWGYVGSFVLYGSIVFLLLGLYMALRGYFAKIKWTSYHQWIVAILVASVFCVFIALGKEFNFHDNEKRIHTNYLSLFYHVEKYVPEITQFRCLGRFIWVFFWAINLTIVTIWQSIYQRLVGRGKYILLVMSIFLLIDMYDRILFFRELHPTNQFNEEKMQEMQKVFEGVESTKYQAILPIPYYHVGSEIMEYTIDPDEYFCTATMQASLLTKLPLMANKQSRAAVYQAASLLDIFTDKPISDSIQKRWNDKPILVLVQKKFLSNTDWGIPQRDVAAYLYHGAATILQRNMTFIKQEGDWELYTWNPKIDSLRVPIVKENLVKTDKDSLTFALQDKNLSDKWVKATANVYVTPADSLTKLSFFIQDADKKAYVNVQSSHKTHRTKGDWIEVSQIWRLPTFHSDKDTLRVFTLNSAGKALLTKEIRLDRIE